MRIILRNYSPQIFFYFVTSFLFFVILILNFYFSRFNTKEGFVQEIKGSGIEKVGATDQIGVNWGDYDGDGYLDLLANKHNTGYLLYHNNHNGTFTDVTKLAGLPLSLPARYASFADYDNDGCVDIYLSNITRDNVVIISHSLLFRNNCDGTFIDVSLKSGLANMYHSRGVAWGDYDHDGFLDLYVTNFGLMKFIRTPTKHDLVGWDYEPNSLYHNNGNGTFTNVAEKSGVLGLAKCNMPVKDQQYLFLENRNNINRKNEATLNELLSRIKTNWQAVWFDYDNDSFPDLYVSNEVTINTLYHNNGNGTFTDTTQSSGLCIFTSSHGVAVGDYDNDGFLDLYVTGSRHNLFFHNNKDGTFSEISEEVGTGNNVFLGWGVGSFDYDNDGDLDIYSVNGTTSNPSGRHSYPSNEDRLYKNNGFGQFENVAEEEGILGNDAKAGAAFGDYNNDGFVDIFVNSDPSLSDTPSSNRLYKNIPNGNHWLTVKLVGTLSNKSGIGARITLVSNGKKQIREVISGDGFMSQNSLWQTFGLGDSKVADTLDISWPSGKVQQLKNMKSDQILTVTEE